jgi:hypothetical protein
MAAAVQTPVVAPPSPKDAIEATRALASAYAGERRIHQILCMASALVAAELHRKEAQ